MKSVLDGVLRQYGLAECIAYTQIRTGLMSETYRVNVLEGRGDAQREYIVQKLHASVANEGATRDAAVVTERLRASGIGAPHFLQSRGGAYLHEGVWRVQTCIDGVTYASVRDAQMAEQAGKALGKMHKALVDMEHDFVEKYNPHDTEHILRTFQKYMKEGKVGGDECEYIAKTLPILVLPADLPKRVIHNDPKLGNIIFGKNSNEGALTCVDFDTCARGTLLFDIGDALRSWCKVSTDDRLVFSYEYAEAALRGYMRHMGNVLVEEEVKYIPQAVQYVATELAARFYIDSVEGTHFGWDAARYPSHAVQYRSRAHEMLGYAQGIDAEILKNVVQNVCPRK